jgi:hypothetical protein
LRGVVALGHCRKLHVIQEPLHAALLPHAGDARTCICLGRKNFPYRILRA